MSRTAEIVLLNLVEGIAPSAISGLLVRFDRTGAILEASPRDLEEAGLPSGPVLALVAARKRGDHEREIARADEAGIALVAPGDVGYPKRLLDLTTPPPLLYVRGSIDEADGAAVAVIGARRCTHYGRAQAARIASDLADSGVTIVSGLARGVDAASHAGALAAGGRTLAVLGCGVDVVYPREHRQLYRKIEISGAVLSEYPLGTPPVRWNFPRRNRIISGLSLGVVVVEASLRSGTLVTVEWALDQGRDVFAVPGNVDSPLSRGTHRLIREGAKLVEEAGDILEELGGYEFMTRPRKTSPSQKGSSPRLGPRESHLLSLLSTTPLPLDDLVQRSGYPVSVVSALLTLLELKGLVTPTPGNRFAATGALSRIVGDAAGGEVRERRPSRRRGRG